MSYLIRTGTGRTNISWSTTANSSTKYLRRTSTGRNNIVWTTIPQGSTYNILQRNGTGRNNILWANLFVGVTLSTKNPGDIVYIKENGTFIPFLVLVHNYPASGRTLLLRKDIHSQGVFYDGYNSYNGTSVDVWCENTYYNMIDSNVKSKITAVNISVCSLLTWTTLSRKVFLLSAYEYISDYYNSSVNNSDYGFKAEGAHIPYFDTDTKRAAASRYWTRTCWYATADFNGGSDSQLAVRGITINQEGSDGGAYRGRSSYGRRPAFTLPSSIDVNTSNQITG